MLFSSYEFVFVFLPVVLAGYVLAARMRPEWVLGWLVACSLFFYGWWNPPYLLLLAGSIAFNFSIGALLHKKRQSGRRKTTLLLAGGIAGNLLLLGYFKYAGFLGGIAASAAGAHWSVEQILLPIGISFFTFQQIAYLVDVSRGTAHEHSLLRYSLFVTFFPQLIAGPIVHHSEVLPQFHRRPALRLDDLAIGLTLFAVGLMKKALIADSLAVPANEVFAAAEAGTPLHFFQAWRGALAYTFQLYFDFSGYSDMALGLARMFGIRLPLNFHSPYKATSIIDFWRRWHMTLSRFLRDYLYLPLGGNRRGRLRQAANIMITMTLGGLWHGAGWTFVFWGALHGCYVMVNHLWRQIRPFHINRWWSRAVARLVTFLAVVVGWVFFRAESFDGAGAMLAGMVNLPHTLAPRLGPAASWLMAMGIRFDGPWVSYDDLWSLAVLAMLLGLVWGLPNTQQWMQRHRPAHDWPPPHSEAVLPRWASWRPCHRWAIYTALLFALGVLGLSQITEFLYFQF